MISLIRKINQIIEKQLTRLGWLQMTRKRLTNRMTFKLTAKARCPSFFGNNSYSNVFLVDCREYKDENNSSDLKELKV